MAGGPGAAQACAAAPDAPGGWRFRLCAPLAPAVFAAFSRARAGSLLLVGDMTPDPAMTGACGDALHALPGARRELDALRALWAQTGASDPGWLGRQRGKQGGRPSGDAAEHDHPLRHSCIQRRRQLLTKPAGRARHPTLHIGGTEEHASSLGAAARGERTRCARVEWQFPAFGPFTQNLGHPPFKNLLQIALLSA